MVVLHPFPAFLFSALFFWTSLDAARILAIPAMDSGSHLMSFMRLLGGLASKGHQIRVMDFAKVTSGTKLPSNITVYDIHIPFVPFDEADIELGPRKRWHRYYTSARLFWDYEQDDLTFGKMIRDHPNALDEIMRTQWDLVISDDIFSPHGYSIGMRLKKERNVPYLMYSTSGQITTGTAEQKSLGRNPVVKSFMFPEPPKSSDDYFRPSVFRYRFYAVWDTIYEIVGFHFVVAKYYMPNIARFGVVDFSWHKLFKDSSVTFSDSLERLGWPVAEGTDLVNTGAYCKSSETLSGELKDFVEDPKSNGTIYIAFGTYADWRYAPDHVINAFANGLQRFPDYRVIMSFNGDRSKMPDLPFIKIVKWAPQTAILNHPKTKVFISHGGLKSIKESVCSRTPLIIMPLFAEQAHNGHMFLALKLGRVLNKFTVTEYDVYNEINEILQNPYYEQKAARTRRIFLDRPLPALDTAVFYAERILRTRAPNHQISFKRKGMDLYWYEYLYAEAVLGLLTMILLIK